MDYIMLSILWWFI